MFDVQHFFDIFAEKMFVFYGKVVSRAKKALTNFKKCDIIKRTLKMTVNEISVAVWETVKRVVGC